MGLSSSKDNTWEIASEKHDATLYYFGGRGMADQIRWMLAATDVSFTQKTIFLREHLQRLSQAQLPFGQLPLLQIDGIELVQSQAIIRYLATRSGLHGKNREEIAKCDMIAEAVKDLISPLTAAPWKRVYIELPEVPTSKITTINGRESNPDQASQAESESEKTSKTAQTLHDTTAISWVEHVQLMKDRWSFIGSRFEAIIRSNRANLNISQSDPTTTFLVGDSMTYSDILVAHVATWYVEECGSEILNHMPLVCLLQNEVISLPGIRSFIKSLNYFPLSGREYCEQVDRVLDKKK
jgi:glutathione S-transferase